MPTKYYLYKISHELNLINLIAIGSMIIIIRDVVIVIVTETA